MARKPPEGMFLDKFLNNNYDWAQEPHLYIILQIPQLLENPAYRCGAAGTALYKDADNPYKSSESSQKGLQGRVQSYHNYFLPNYAKLYAALRIRKQLVALPGQRTAGDEGLQYNVDRGNQTEVLAREKHLHAFLDQKGLRWRKETRKELFVPKQGVMQLVEALRKVQGLQLLLFDEDDWREDTAYTGGSSATPKGLEVVETVRRGTQARVVADSSVIIRLSSAGIQQLRDGQPQAFDKLMNLMREAFKELQPTAPKPNPPPRPPSPAPSDLSDATTTVTLPAATINAIRPNATVTPTQRAAAVAQLVPLVTPRVTRAQAKAALLPRRSNRLAAMAT